VKGLCNTESDDPETMLEEYPELKGQVTPELLRKLDSAFKSAGKMNWFSSKHGGC
jgi:hypothetical protein